MKIHSLFLVLFLFVILSCASKKKVEADLIIKNGIVYNDNSYSIEGVHVLNITSNEATITNSEGNFRILVNLNDELIFSAIQFKRKKITMNQDIFDSLSITVYLEEFVNELDEVILNSSQLLFRIYKQQSKFDSAFKYLQITSALKDTLAQQNKINDIDNISLNESIREQEKAEQESQKNKFIIGFAVIFILSFSALYIYNRNKQKESIRKIEDDRKNKELKAAQDFQNSLLPKHLPKRADLDIATYIRSSTEVGGDYYDFFVQPDNNIFVVCGDATGHGTPAGMLVSIIKAGLIGIPTMDPNLILATSSMTKYK